MEFSFRVMEETNIGGEDKRVIVKKQPKAKELNFVENIKVA
jgi:hypothetical protein